MGVTSLRDLVSIAEYPLTAYRGETVAVDAHHWLFKYLTVQVSYMDEETYTTQAGDEVPNLIGILRGLPTLLKHDITPVFVFDGEANEMKTAEIQSRIESKEQAKEQMEQAREAGDVEAAKRYKAQSQYLTPVIKETSRGILERFGIPYVEADGAGEGYAARLAATDGTGISVAFSGDYDTVLFGSPRTVRSFTGSGPAEEISLHDSEQQTGLTRAQLVDAAILIGTDYNEGVRGIGPKRAVKKLKAGGDAISIAADWGSDTVTESVVRDVREIFLNPPNGTYTIGESNVRSQPDFTAAKSYLVDEWELPVDTVVDNLNRFPGYTQ